MADVMAPENDNLIDIYLDVPKELNPNDVYPEKLHILFNKKAVTYAEQYKDMLFVSRNLPFNVDTVNITDPVALLLVNTMKAKGGIKSEEAARRAQQSYKRWIATAEQEAWTLAILYDNEFENAPTDYPPPPEPAPGIAVIPEPVRSLVDPVEYRLKQIADVFNISREFRELAEQAINDTLTKMAQYGEAVKEADPFRLPSRPTRAEVPGSDGSDGGGEVVKSRKRTTR